MGQVLLDVGDGVYAEMEDAGGEDGVGLAEADGVEEVMRSAGAATGDDGDGGGFGDGAVEFEVVAALGAVTVHTVDDNFASAKLGGADGPFDGVEVSVVAAIATGADADAPARRIAAGDAEGVEAEDDALAAEGPCAV